MLELISAPLGARQQLQGWGLESSEGLLSHAWVGDAGFPLGPQVDCTWPFCVPAWFPQNRVAGLPEQHPRREPRGSLYALSNLVLDICCVLLMVAAIFQTCPASRGENINSAIDGGASTSFYKNMWKEMYWCSSFGKQNWPQTECDLCVRNDNTGCFEESNYRG